MNPEKSFVQYIDAVTARTGAESGVTILSTTMMPYYKCRLKPGCSNCPIHGHGTSRQIEIRGWPFHTLMLYYRAYWSQTMAIVQYIGAVLACWLKPEYSVCPVHWCSTCGQVEARVQQHVHDFQCVQQEGKHPKKSHPQLSLPKKGPLNYNRLW